MSTNYDDVLAAARDMRPTAPASDDYSDVLAAAGQPPEVQGPPTAAQMPGTVASVAAQRRAGPMGAGQIGKTSTSADTLGGALRTGFQNMGTPFTKMVGGQSLSEAITPPAGTPPPEGGYGVLAGLGKSVARGVDVVQSPMGAVIPALFAIPGVREAAMAYFGVQGAKMGWEGAQSAAEGYGAGNPVQVGEGLGDVGQGGMMVAPMLGLPRSLARSVRELNPTPDLAGAGPRLEDATGPKPAAPYPVLDQITAKSTPYTPEAPDAVLPPPGAKIEVPGTQHPAQASPAPELTRPEADLQVAEAQAAGVQQAKQDVLDRQLTEIDARAKARGMYDDVLEAAREVRPEDQPAQPVPGPADGNVLPPGPAGPGAPGDIAPGGVAPGREAAQVEQGPVPASAERGPAEGIADDFGARLEEMANAARERSRERAQRIVSQANDLGNVTKESLAQLNDWAIIGAHHLWRAGSRGTKLALNFADWSKAMIEEAGERITPYLETVWKKAQKYFAEKFDPEAHGVITPERYSELVDKGIAEGGHEWYDKGKPEFYREFGDDAEKQLKYQGAASPRVPVLRSIKDTHDAYTAEKLEEPPPIVYPNTKPGSRGQQLEIVRGGGEPSGAKVVPYTEAHLGYDRVPADTWEHQMTFPEYPGEITDHHRRFIELRSEAEAKKRGLLPQEVQAAGWVGHRKEALGEKLESNQPYAETALDQWNKGPWKDRLKEVNFDFDENAIREHRRRNASAFERSHYNWRSPTRLVRASDSPIVHQPYGIVTAENPFEGPLAGVALSDEQRAVRHQALHDDIVDLGYPPPKEVVGRYRDDGTPEPGWLVPGLSDAHAFALGKKYGQESTFISYGNRHGGLLYNAGENIGKLQPADFEHVSFNGPETNYYTTMVVDGKTVKFSVPVKDGFENAMVPIEHYTRQAGLETVDPEFMGTDQAGAERARADREPAQHFYEQGAKPEWRFEKPGYVKKTGFRSEKRTYDLAADPEKFIEKAQGDITQAEKDIHDAGYDFIKVGDVTKAMEPVMVGDPTTYLERAKQRLAERRAQRKGVVVGSGLGSLNDFAEDLPDLAIIGAAHLAKFAAEGGYSFKEWATRMVEDGMPADKADQVFSEALKVIRTENGGGPKPPEAPVDDKRAPELAKGSLRKGGATFALEQQRLEKQLKPIEKRFDVNKRKNGKGSNYDFMIKMEKGDLSDPDAKVLRGILDKSLKRVQDLGTGALDNYIEDYFPHQWKDPEAAAQAIKELRRSPLEGSKSFLKHRTIDTIEAGMLERGFEPRWDNPVDAVRLKVAEMDRYVYAQKSIQEGVDQGWVTTFEGQRPPVGMTKIEVSGGQYAARPEVAKVFNRYLSKGLTGRQDNIGTAYRAYMKSASFLNQAQLGLSGFHATMTGMNSILSTVELGMRQTLTKGQRLQGLGNMAKGILPSEPIIQVIRGNRLIKEALAERGVTADTLTKGGGRIGMEHWYFNNSAGRFMRAIRRGEYGKAALGALPAAIETAAKPIMQYQVPRAKIAAFMDMAKAELERLGPEASEAEKVHALGKIYDSVDNRFGQLAYDNLFWEKAVKDLGIASVRALGYNLGTLRELGGGVKDFATMGSRLKGKTGFNDAVVTPRMAYVVALPFVAGLYGAIFGYLHGKPPETLDDYFHPYSGDTNDDGTPEKVNLPTYMKEVTGDLHAVLPQGRLHTKGVLDVVAAKSNPMLQTVLQTLSNKDFFDKPIRNEDDPAVKQLQQYFDYLAQQMIPFSARTRTQEQDLPRHVEQFFGATHAPRWAQPDYNPRKESKRSPYGPQDE